MEYNGRNLTNIERYEVQQLPENSTKSEKVHNTLTKLIKYRRYYGVINNLFDDTLNIHIEDEHMIIIVHYLDSLNYMCMKEAEKGCRKIRIGAIPFLEEISFHGCRLRVWNIAVNLKKGTRINIAIIMIMSIKANITVPLFCTVDQDRQHLEE